MTALITLRDVTKIYGGAGRPALDAVDLEIESGCLTAIMGPSGCGKSTLLNLIGGLDRPTRGEVVVDGIRIDRLGEAASARYRRSTVGFVFQFFHLLEDLSVLDNVVVAARLAGVERSEARRRALELLEQLGLETRTGRFPATLSGGERQRVAIARALVNRPAVLLADEPTGALDSHNGEAVLSLFDDLGRRGQTIVLVTHDPRVVEARAARTIWLVDGAVVRSGGSTSSVAGGGTTTVRVA